MCPHQPRLRHACPAGIAWGHLLYIAQVWMGLQESKDSPSLSADPTTPTPAALGGAGLGRLHPGGKCLPPAPPETSPCC